MSRESTRRESGSGEFGGSAMELLVATRNAGKMAEIRRLLANVPALRLTGLDEAEVPEEPAEDGLEVFGTFEENALAKAEYFFARTGLPTVADDSGLVVDALGGAPGVRSKRFAPEQHLRGEALDLANNRHLAERLAGTDAEARTARYVCVAALAMGRAGTAGAERTAGTTGPATLRVVRGEAEGRILLEPRGKGGFGYDPYVLDPETRRTFAEMSPEEKDRRSHRGKAFRALARVLRATGSARSAGPGTHPEPRSGPPGRELGRGEPA